MKKLLTIALSLLSVVCLSYTVFAGSLDSPGAPSAGSGMYTLQNLYDYLTNGTALTVQTSFQEPTSGPTTGTMKTTKEIGDAVKALFNLCATTTAADVRSGQPFFCTQAGSWGVQTGTAIVITLTPTPTITPTPTATKTWYEQYGPAGEDKVVLIGSMYVASDKDGLGCAGAGFFSSANALTWADGLVWLDKSDWELGTLTQQQEICNNANMLNSHWDSSYTMSSTYVSGDTWRIVKNGDCAHYDTATGPEGYYVRAIRPAN